MPLSSLRDWWPGDWWPGDSWWTIDVVGALEEGVHHPSHRLVEHQANGGLQDPAQQLKINKKGDLGPQDIPQRMRSEIPLIIEVAEGPVFVSDLHAMWPVKDDADGKD